MSNPKFQIKIKASSINWSYFILTFLLVSALFVFGLFRINIDADIVESLPKNDPVVSDAIYFFDNHPMLDQLIIDLGLKKAAPDILVECGDLVENELMNSGLFQQVGISDFRKLIPGLIAHILDNLPALFTERDLSEKIGPLLEPGAIKEKLDNIYSSLHNLEGIGQGEFIASDPLGLRDLVLSRLAHLAPGRNVKFHGENLLSSDSRHLLVIANPIMSGTDTAFARKVTALMDQVRSRIEQRYAKSGYEFILTPVGAYRSALDNETTIRRDVKKAILFATLGIILLLLLAFPRPLLGVLSLVPALLGVMSAFFVYSLFHQSISVMVLGFGGAIISITVDHGIAYLLFLDRPLQTSGKEASREVWSVGLIAVLTSVGAFGALVMSGFPVLEQLGKFTALGIAFSFLFVHTLFPAVFRETRPAAPRRRPLQGLVNKFASTGKIGACCACVFFLVMVFFAKPEFNVKLSAMNTVSKDTIEAEKLITNVWGNIFDKVYLMTEGKSVETLQSKSDQQLALMEEDFASDRISSGFVPSMIFPGTKQRKQNFMAWKNFWTRARVAALKRNVKEISLDLGFATGAFAPFFSRIGRDVYLPEESGIPDRFFTLAGIREKDDGLTFVHVSGLTVGASYEADRFFNKYGTLGRIFDQAYFSQRLGRLLFSTFTRMLVLIVICVAALLFFFFFDLRLTGAALLPISFAMISTLGTLKLIGHPLDISGLMLSIIVIGMGVDYSIFFVRSYQRYGNAFDPLFGLIRMAVFMAAVSTLIGFGILCFAEHSLLRSAGLTCLFGIGYSLIGAFILLPPVLDRIFKQREKPGKARGTVNERVLNRYRNLESYPRMFARFKMRFDPMFSELGNFVGANQNIRTIIDIGCGHGVPGNWLLECFPGAKIYGIDPDPNHVRTASMSMGRDGVINRGRAPHVPEAPLDADVAMLLDIMHYLKDNDLKLTLDRLRRHLVHEGLLIIRAVIPPTRRFPFIWWLENFKLRISKTDSYYRSEEAISTMIRNAGFRIVHSGPSGGNEESVWFIAQVDS